MKQFLVKARTNPQWAQDNFMQFIAFQIGRARCKEIAECTISNYYKATKLFCEMNDLTLSWKKILRGLPIGRRAANDRAPTIEEIQKLVEYPDRRIKPIIYTMASSGIRIGAWDCLQWKHVTPLHKGNEEIVAAKLLIYPGDQEEYYTFITPEAYTTLKEWIPTYKDNTKYIPLYLSFLSWLLDHMTLNIQLASLFSLEISLMSL